MQVMEGRLRGEIKTLEGSMNEKFEKIDEKFEKIDERFEKIDERFERVYADSDRILTVLVNIDKRLKGEHADHEVRIVRLEKVVL